MGKHEQFFLPWSLDIWYVASSSGPLSNVRYALGLKWARPGAHMFNIGLYRENMKKRFV